MEILLKEIYFHLEWKHSVGWERLFYILRIIQIDTSQYYFPGFIIIHQLLLF